MDKKEKYLDKFNDDNENDQESLDYNKKKIINKTKDGLLERVDKELIVEDGRKLLRD